MGSYQQYEDSPGAEDNEGDEEDTRNEYSSFKDQDILGGDPSAFASPDDQPGPNFDDISSDEEGDIRKSICSNINKKDDVFNDAERKTISEQV